MRGYNVKVNGKSYFVEIEEAAEGRTEPVALPKKTEEVKRAQTNGLKVTAPLPGLVLKLVVQNGATVKKGDKIVVLEAMKMEHDIVSKADGKVEFLAKQGDSVAAGADLAVIS